MNFANYTAFRNAVALMIDGDDSSGAIKTTTLDLIIALGENAVYEGDGAVSGLRSRDMVSPLSLTVTANAATLPADCLELSVVYFDGEPPLEALAQRDALARLDWGNGGRARFYAQDGNTVIFYPAASGTALGRYFKRPADIAGGTHATFNRYPEVFLYAALAASAPLLGEDDRLPMWKKLWADAMGRADTIERNVATAGGAMRMRTR